MIDKIATCTNCTLEICTPDARPCPIKADELDRNNEAVKRYVARNPERRRETQRNRYEKNKIEINAKKREWRKRRNESKPNTDTDTKGRRSVMAHHTNGNDRDTALARLEII